MIRSSTKEGFTLVEIMIVVSIIALLTTIAVPAFLKYQRDTQDALYMSQLRIAKDAFKCYYIKHGAYPPDVWHGVQPPEIVPYLPNLNWSNATPIGGLWDWDEDNFDVVCGLSIRLPDRTDEEMKRIDEIIDDGDLDTGIFQKKKQRYMYIIEK